MGYFVADKLAFYGGSTSGPTCISSLEIILKMYSLYMHAGINRMNEYKNLRIYMNVLCSIKDSWRRPRTKATS